MNTTIFQKSKKALTIAATAAALLVSQSSFATFLEGTYKFDARGSKGAQTLTWQGNSATIKGKATSGRYRGMNYTIQYHDVQKKVGRNNEWLLLGLTGNIRYENGDNFSVGRHRYGHKLNAQDRNSYALYLFGSDNSVHNWSRGLGDIHAKVSYVKPPKPPKPPVPVPAPASVLLMGLGLAGVGLLKKKKK